MNRHLSIKLEDGYVKVVHDKRGTICAGVLLADRVHDITFTSEEYRKQNMIRMPAMTALQNWERARLARLTD